MGVRLSPRRWLLALIVLSCVVAWCWLRSSTHFPALPALLERDRLWPPALIATGRRPKLYTYPLPPALALSSAQLAQCRWSAYSSELLVHALLLDPPATLSRHLDLTSDPQDADFFFVPLFASCFLFNCWTTDGGWDLSKRCNVDAAYITPVLDHVATQGFWSDARRNHLIPHPMDRADDYYEPATRARMRNGSIYLVTNGDKRPSPFSDTFRHHVDIVIPSATHLLNSYHVNPRDYLSEEGLPWKVPRGYAAEWMAGRPVPSEKAPDRVEIFEPTPPSLFPRTTRAILSSATDSRSIKVIFRGGGSTDEGERYSLSIRDLFYPSPPSTPPALRHPGFSSLAGYSIAPSASNEEYARDLAHAQFGLVPPGYTLDTTRLWEYLAFGVVPVFLGTGTDGGQVLPFEFDFRYRDFSLSIPRDRVHLLPEILARVSSQERDRLARGVWEVGRKLVLEQGEGNVWKWIARELNRRLAV